MKNGILTQYADADSPAPSNNWLILSEKERLNKINEVIIGFTKNQTFVITRAYDDGQVSLKLSTYMEAKERGPLLLELERYLKSFLEESITVWHDPIGDKNSLRKQFRGIEVKHE